MYSGIRGAETCFSGLETVELFVKVGVKQGDNDFNNKFGIWG